MNPRDFLSVAETLIKQPSPSPADCRTVIGRSYYAALNVFFALVAELRIPLDKQKDSHKEVMDLVAESQDADLRFASVSLAAQKMVRKNADYDMNNHDVEKIQKAGQALLLAKETISRLDRTRNDAALWSIASQRMLAHARAIGKLP
jgi:hypothetical protein